MSKDEKKVVENEKKIYKINYYTGKDEEIQIRELVTVQGGNTKEKKYSIKFIAQLHDGQQMATWAELKATTIQEAFADLPNATARAKVELEAILQEKRSQLVIPTVMGQQGPPNGGIIR